MGSDDNKRFDDFHVITNGPGSDAYSNEESINLDSYIAQSTSFCSKIYNPQLYVEKGNGTTDWCQTSGGDYPEKSSINSDITLSYIDKILMQEDIDDRGNEDTALQAMEEPFYELLGEKYPAFPQQQPLCVCDHLQNLSANTDKSNGHACNTWSVTRMTNISSSMNSNGNFQGFQFPWSLSSITRETEQFTHHSNRMVVGLKVDGLSISEKPSQDNCSLQIDAHYMRKHPLFEVHDRKSYPCIEDLDLLEGRSNKQYAIYYDEPIRDEMFDNVLLCSDHKPLDEGVSLSRAMTNNSSKSSQIGQGKTSARRKTTGKRIQKRDVVDLRTLLINCAQAVSVSNHSLASDILKIIRHHASPTGDDSQRLALCLAYCLDVRLTGTGSQIYHKFITKRRNVKDILKVFHVCLSTCPFLRASHYFSNRTIVDVSKGKPQVHIIDFGICFGFQWPSLFEELAKIEDGPPKLRITGIELPESGFRPYARSNNIGLRLADYAKTFNIPFEYQHISSNKWEALSPEDFNIEKDEVLIVNCIYRMKDLGDETISINSARSRVLNTIRMMKPKVFVQGVLNGSYGVPFFLTRFKEVMYHYNSLFDMLDKNIPRDNETRMIIERDIYQYIMLNVIACEGPERIERPESYKKWKVRNLKAGLVQLPLNPAIVRETQDMVRKGYHKDFLVDEEDQWLVLGWKGRILYASSTWQPNDSGDSD
ncbi:hypothetical protein OsI_12502 [Oryza sativa Indica Group]|uniref:Uncharacterized protein n=1 Tax=Oryza sativa subsp. indica TaxID=39946 RepID=B8AM74_ORYSI|nr:hypothetical protein OsI_12502 [Oryza sativa Indica Group]